VLAARIDRLSARDKELLQTLAVIGREFALSLVRRLVEGMKDDELERMLADLQVAEFIYEQPATGDLEYIFKHALSQEVSYNSLLIEQRKRLHERTGAALESIFAEQLDDHLDELGHHYSRSDNIEKAAEYLGRAGQQAARRSAYADAVGSLGMALNLLQKLPYGAQPIRELPLQLAFATALTALKGWAAPEVERAYTRARELCDRSSDPKELFNALLGMWLVYLLRGEVRKAYGLVDQLLRLAQRASDSTLTLQARHAMGSTSYWMGQLLRAKENFESAIALYDLEHHRGSIVRYGGLDAKVRSLCYLAMTLWQLGYADQALNKANAAIVLSQSLPDPFTIVFAGSLVGTVYQFRREARATEEIAGRTMALSAENGFSHMHANATALYGWALVAQGYHEEGIAQIREALTAYRATGAYLLRPYNLCQLAETCKESGDSADGLSALKEALAMQDECEIRSYEGETHRLKGELLLRQQDSNAAEVRRCFDRAIEVARRQSAKSWELRATTSLARLLRDTDRRDEARTMLAEIYSWFTEGFDTADLKDAKALLEELDV
jgi:predicted ATPase